VILPILVLAFATQLPQNTVCGNSPFHAEATPVANNSTYVATGYNLYADGVLLVSKTPGAAIVNNVVYLDHPGLPVGTHQIVMSVSYQAISSTTVPQSGESFPPSSPQASAITGSFIDCTSPPPPSPPSVPTNARFVLAPLPGSGVAPAIVSSQSAGSGGNATVAMTIAASAGQYMAVGIAQTSSSQRIYTVTDSLNRVYKLTSSVGNGRAAIIATTQTPLAASGAVTVTVRADASATYSVRVFVLTANGIDATGSTGLGVTGTNTLVPCAQPGTTFAQSGFAICLGVVTTTAGMTAVAGTETLFGSSNISWYKKDGAPGRPVDLAFRRGACTSCIGMAASIRIW
jgi:hypothetical protein